MAKRPFVVGFAAETNDVEENARSKLKRKKLDMIAANQVGDGIAFDCEDNALTVIWPGGKVEVARGPKARRRARTHRTDREAPAAADGRGRAAAR
jgi:phosphopantothenoylcysteine decarboxylase / phosphopantothenate---cysteine ligase